MPNDFLSGSISIPAFQPPGGYGYAYTNQMLAFGRQIRDDLAWQYPLFPGALFTFQQMASNREWKITGKPRSVARGVEYLNNAQCLNYNGIVDYGFESFLRRRAIDYPTVGRTMYTWGENGKPLRYLDPGTVYFDIDRRLWIEPLTNETFDLDHIVVNHPLPIGGSGNFISPMSFVIPTAMLAWLIREHDRAAADGRKIRDIILVASDEMKDAIKDAVADTVKLWTGESDPSKDGVPVVSFDPAANGLTSMGGFKMSDMIATFGLANIPPSFNREQFQFQYVNELATSLGLALRYIWNSEKATNRALEEVQEQRQSQRGPAAFVRCEQRLHNQSGELAQFGADTRFAFIEEVDVASQQTDANVLKLYAESFDIFVKNLGGTLNIDALIAWLQRDQILPADLNIITANVELNPDQTPAPVNGNVQQNSDATSVVTKAAPVDDIEYDEISMNGDGQIIEQRHKSISFSQVLRPEMVRRPLEAKAVVSFDEAVKKARTINVEKFKGIISDQKFPQGYTEEQKLIIKSIYEHVDSVLNEGEHRQIKSYLDALV